MNPMMLTKEAFATSQQFIETTARSVDVARFHHAFAGAPAEHVIDALSAYQNDDGGFGHGLEPDLQTNDSSVLCSSVSLQILSEIDTEQASTCLEKVLSYLLHTLDRTRWHWRIIPPSAAHSPHAPWWGQSSDEDRFEAASLNPTAEILGYLYDYQAQIPDNIVPAVTEQVLAQLAALESIEMHDLLCCLRLLKAAHLPATLHAQIIQHLTPLVIPTVECAPEKWSSYCLRPLDVVDSPDSPFMAGLEEAVAANLDYEINAQNDAGAWLPAWSWGDAFPKTWPSARQAWAGAITVNKLLMLKAFGRIEDV